MSDDSTTQQQGAAGTNTSGGEGEPITPEMYKKSQERAQRFEAQLKESEKKYSQFASIYKDIDPDEARALKTKLEEAEKKAAEKDPAKMEELFEKKLRKHQGEWT